MRLESLVTMPSSDTRCRSVLIAEDDAQLREVLKDFLEMHGYVVHCAANGFEASGVLSSIQEQCLVLLDLNMPVLSGLDFIDIAEESSRIFPLPIIVITAAPAETVPATARNVKAVFAKPLPLDRLLAAISKLCQSVGPRHAP